MSVVVELYGWLKHAEERNGQGWWIIKMGCLSVNQANDDLDILSSDILFTRNLKG